MADLKRVIEQSGKDLHRVIIVRPAQDGDDSYFQELFQMAGRPIPPALRDWESRVAAWCDEYGKRYSASAILEVNLQIAIYLFDRTLERVLVAYGASSPQLEERDMNRMRRFPDVNVGVRAILGTDAFAADRGHFLGHASGGELDINLFPQRKELNRGWSAEGKVFRSMERFAAEHLGTFMYHRPIYDDETWIPDRLEFGLLTDDREWWIEEFQNK